MTAGLGEVKIGVSSSLKLDSEDAGKAAKAVVDKEVQEATATILNKGQIKYTTIGEPVFGCFTQARRRIRFKGGMFVVDTADANAVDIINALDYHVTVGTLKKEEYGV